MLGIYPIAMVMGYILDILFSWLQNRQHFILGNIIDHILYINACIFNQIRVATVQDEF